MIIIFDIGGTSTRVARSLDDETIDAEQIFKTPHDPIEGLSLLIEKIKIIAGDLPIKIISGGMAGVLKGGTIVHSPNISSWNGTDIIATIQKSFPESKIMLGNDADLACLAEAKRGVGKGFHRVAYMTISTGIGGGLVIDGQVAQGIFDFEPGQQIIDFEKRATLESIASGTAIQKKYGEMINNITDHKTVHTIVSMLAIGIYNTIVHWSPDIFVLGGGVVLAKPELVDLVKGEVEHLMSIYPKIPEFKMTTLGDQNVLYGALTAGTQSDL